MTIASSKAALLAAIETFGDAVYAGIHGGGAITGRAYTEPEPVPFTTVPEFDASLSNVFEFGVMTNNVASSTITNPEGGQTIQIRTQQDATGGRTFAVPANAFVSGVFSTDPDTVNILTLSYVASEVRWEGTWTSIAA